MTAATTSLAARKILTSLTIQSATLGSAFVLSSSSSTSFDISAKRVACEAASSSSFQEKEEEQNEYETPYCRKQRGVNLVKRVRFAYLIPFCESRPFLPDFCLYMYIYIYTRHSHVFCSWLAIYCATHFSYYFIFLLPNFL